MQFRFSILGWAHLCQMRNLVCPKVSRAVVKCAEARDRFDCKYVKYYYNFTQPFFNLLFAHLFQF